MIVCPASLTSWVMSLPEPSSATSGLFASGVFLYREVLIVIIAIFRFCGVCSLCSAVDILSSHSHFFHHFLDVESSAAQSFHGFLHGSVVFYQFAHHFWFGSAAAGNAVYS